MAVLDVISTPCTLVHVTQDAGLVDEYNDPTSSEVSEPAWCELQLERSDEEAGANVERSVWRVYLRAEGIQPPSGHDRLEDVAGYPGSVFELIGAPNPAYSLRPVRRLHHYEAVARDVAGADQ